MLRITTTTRDDTTWLALEGRLAGPWVDELDAALRDARAAGRAVALDLAHLCFADARGLAALRGHVAAGLVQRSSSFVSELLTEEERR